MNRRPNLGLWLVVAVTASLAWAILPAEADTPITDCVQLSVNHQQVYESAACNVTPSTEVTTFSSLPPSTIAPTSSEVETSTTWPSTSTTSPPAPTSSAVPPVTTVESTSSSAPSTSSPPTAPPTTVPPSTTDFLLDFAAQSDMGRLIFDVHDGASYYADWNTPEEWDADHDMACGNPNDHSRHVESGHKNANGTYTPSSMDGALNNLFYWCQPPGGNAHFMTTMFTGNYITIAFTPKGDDGKAKVFPASTSKVCWDQNTTNLGSRKWTQLLLVPAARYAAGRQEPAAYINPHFIENGGPDGILVQPSQGDFMFVNVQNSLGVISTVDSSITTGDQAENDKAGRYQQCVVDNKNGSVTVTQKTTDKTFVRTVAGRFPQAPMVVIWQDETYNSPKAESPPSVANFDTWHWDNLTVS